MDHDKTKTDRRQDDSDGEQEYWLDNPRNVDRVCYILYALCVGLATLDFFYDKHAHFHWEEWLNFFGFFGLIAYVLLVLAANLLRKVVMRKEDYYD